MQRYIDKSLILACPAGQLYDELLKPWVCICDRTIYTQTGDFCMQKTEAEKINNNYPEASAINIQFKDELEVNIQILL